MHNENLRVRGTLYNIFRGGRGEFLSFVVILLFFSEAEALIGTIQKFLSCYPSNIALFTQNVTLPGRSVRITG